MQIHLDLNKKDTIFSDLTFYSYPKQLDAMIPIYNLIIEIHAFI